MCYGQFFLTESLVSAVLISLTFLTNPSYSVYLRTYYTTLFTLLKSTGVVSNFAISNLSTLLFKLLKLLGTFFNLSISNLSTADFKLAKSVFLGKSDVSKSVVFF